MACSTGIGGFLTRGSERAGMLCGSASRIEFLLELLARIGLVSRAIPTCAPLWPTPKQTINRVGVKSLRHGGHGGDGHWSAPGLEQMVELSLGIVPREVESVDEIASPA